ncbi:hypothetical protein [Methanosarcina sp.]|uniref:hypothetical protein n=1 Tax=Methanosarcina sp. TaxID=2213 RepID=UPI002988322C|nr:hypothetical protein [Methanosarcina sp.]MDW5551763.1 hypothetical protein [Methanosarcina sp.]MDW5555113.1 hypothetical protein [Methanosarcina sp.]MDW5560799.1 hypothetical protein [Methanosarcina sp.]
MLRCPSPVTRVPSREDGALFAHFVRSRGLNQGSGGLATFPTSSEHLKSLNFVLGHLAGMVTTFS